jgi:hypothetical protein
MLNKCKTQINQGIEGKKGTKRTKKTKKTKRYKVVEGRSRKIEHFEDEI